MATKVRDEVTLKRFVQVDKRHVELRPDSHEPVLTAA